MREKNKTWIWIIRVKKYVKIDRETGSDKIFALLDQVESDLEDDTDNLMNNSDTNFTLEEILENEVDSDDEPLNSSCCWKSNYWKIFGRR